MRAPALGALGVLIGISAWVVTLYATAFVFSPWKEDDPAYARAAFVAAEIAVIAALLVGANRAPRFRALLTGAVISYVTISVLFHVA